METAVPSVLRLCVLSAQYFTYWGLRKVHHTILHSKFNHPKPKFHIAYMLKTSIKTTQKSYSKYIHSSYLKLAVSLCSMHKRDFKEINLRPKLTLLNHHPHNVDHAVSVWVCTTGTNRSQKLHNDVLKFPIQEQRGWYTSLLL